MSAPFGITIHDPLDPNITEADMGQSKYKVSPPKPHPSFETYYAQQSRSHGVVWLKGISATISNDAFGGQTRSVLEKLSGQLETRYGRPRKADTIQPGSIWDDPQYWTMSIAQNERFFFHIWERPNAQLPDDLQSIFLGILAYDGGSSSVMIEYSSTKAELAEQEADQDLSDLL